jgi:PKD repeat protein
VAVATVGAGLAPIAISPGVNAAEGDVGTLGFQYGEGTAERAPDPDLSPTASKPQSKLWYAQNRWWGVLLHNDTNTFRIYRYSAGSDAWVDTGVVVDDRERAHLDVLWDGTTLFTVGAVDRLNTTSADAVRFKRFQYDTQSAKYVQETSYAKTLNAGGVEAPVIAKDSTNRLWVAWTTDEGFVRVVASTSGGASWTTTQEITVPDGSGLNADDLAAIAAHDGKISLAFSKQAPSPSPSQLVVASHPDSAAANTGWTSEVLASEEFSTDDHISMTLDGDGTGRVFLAVKTNKDDAQVPNPTDPLIKLYVLNGGAWTSYVHSDVSEEMTRPRVVVDSTDGLLRIYTTSPVAGGVIYEKTTSLSSPGVFTAATEVMKLADAPLINNVTTTKQNRPPDSGLLLLASDQRTGRYVHRVVSPIAVEAPVANFSYKTGSGADGLAVTFTNTSTDAASYSWDFGDGSSKDVRVNPTHTYAKAGTYKVVLTATNSAGTNTKELQVTVEGSSTVEGPRTRMTEPNTMFTRDGFVDVAWGPLTNADKVATYTVRRKASTVSSTFRSETNWRTATGARAGGFVGSPGATYCMRVQGTDAAGNIGKWSSPRCTAVPLDDRRVNKSTQWKAVKNRAAYLETLLKTRSSGARLTKKVAGKHVSLVVTKSPGSGRIAIYKGRTLVKRVSLNAAQRRDKVFIPVLATRRVQTSNIRVVVLTRGKPVLIDGLAVSRR